MVIKYNVEIHDEAILYTVEKVTNQIFKLLPLREEGGDWQSPLENLIIEIAGMSRLLENHNNLFPLLCRMEGLLTLTEENDFLSYRKTIFECLGLMNKIRQCL